MNNNTTYYWKIVAKDNQNATTSGPIWSFTTLNQDVTPPEVVSAALLDSVTLHIIFSEPLEQTGAENSGNYSITNNISVLSASLSNSEVTLTTSEHLPNLYYTVTVNNVTDLAGNLISPTANTASYEYIISNELTKLPIDSAYASAWFQNYTPPKAIDGITEPIDPESRWGGALPMPDSIMFDLGQEEMVGQTRFSFYEWNSGRIYTYSVYSSIDDINWSPVVENVSSTSNEWSILNFNLIECRYIKLISVNNNQSQWAGLYEAELWGEAPNPVEFSSFTANTDNGDVNINWTTATEKNNRLFFVERKKGNGDFSTIGTVPGNGTTTLPHSYTFKDKSVSTGSYFYRIKQMDFDGRYTYSDKVNVNVNWPTSYTLEQNFPNPFNPTTTIQYSVPEKSLVKISIFNVIGQEVESLVNEEKQTGVYNVVFTAVNLPSGVYFYNLQSGNLVITKKMVLLK